MATQGPKRGSGACVWRCCLTAVHHWKGVALFAQILVQGAIIDAKFTKKLGRKGLLNLSEHKRQSRAAVPSHVVACMAHGANVVSEPSLQEAHNTNGADLCHLNKS